MSDVTRILSQIEQGDPAAAEQLLPLVYDELRNLAARKLAQEKPGQTLQATALVHEAYLRLVAGGGKSEVRDQKSEVADPTSDLRPPTSDLWHSRGHFFAAAAEAMRRILVDIARRKASEKGGGGLKRQLLEEAQLTTAGDADELLALDEALTRLMEVDPNAASVVKLRYFAGLTVEQTAASLGISPRTTYNLWIYARSWLQKAIREQ